MEHTNDNRIAGNFQDTEHTRRWIAEMPTEKLLAEISFTQMAGIVYAGLPFCEKIELKEKMLIEEYNKR
jgi:hypothetical protein